MCVVKGLPRLAVIIISVAVAFLVVVTIVSIVACCICGCCVCCRAGAQPAPQGVPQVIYAPLAPAQSHYFEPPT
jgi:hypothetical protein